MRGKLKPKSQDRREKQLAEVRAQEIPGWWGWAGGTSLHHFPG